jgi:predicted dithiol-disulfide oxidoreductase (DUF899 family)
MTTAKSTMENHRVVSTEEWVEARKAHLAKEKEFTRLRDELSADRRELPWVKIDKEYVFEGPAGKVTLADLFEGRSQLFIYHFMWRWDLDAGCPSCSYVMDNVSGALVHLENHDVKFVAVSRGPFEKIDAFKKRLGWDAMLVSSYESDFNFDYNVSFTDEELATGKIYYNYQEMPAGNGNEAPGASIFFKDENGDIYHTYSTFTRGLDILLTTYNMLDMTPKGRNEEGAMNWLRYNDEYPAASGEAKQDAEACH